MATDDQNQNIQRDAGADAPPAGGSNDDGQVDLSTLPEAVQAYIRELREEAKTYRLERKDAVERARALEEATRQQQQAALAEQGRFKELAEQRAAEVAKLQPYQERAQTLEAMLRESNQRRMEQVPEDMRPLIPDDYAPEKLAGWLDANISLLTKPTPPSLDGGAGGAGGTRIELSEQEREIARRLGMSDEDYAKNKARGNRGG